MKLLKQSVIIFGVMFLFGCESEPPTTLKDSVGNNSVDQASIQQTLAINAGSQAVDKGDEETVYSYHLYNPSAGELPSAIDLLFKDSQDGTLNIPIVDGDPKAPLKAVMNAMDGFSTNAPISTRFSAALDRETITSAAVRMFEVKLSGFGKAVVKIEDELTFGDDFVADLSSVDPTKSTLVVLPYKRPLKPDTSYYVVITNSLMDMSGNSVKPSEVYSLAKNSNTTYTDATLEQLRQLISASEFTVDYAYEDLAAVNIVASWSFTTQSVGKTLTTVRSLVGTPTTSISASNAVVGANGAGKSPLGAANIYEGTLTVPYYLTAPSAGDPTANLTKYWSAANAVGGENNLTRLNTLPAATNPALEIPLLMTAPNPEAFPAPWKTVIFQHGLTKDRTVMLAVADTLAQVGFATVAIDLPLHGVDSSNPLYQSGKERTFEVDFVNEDGTDREVVGADGPDSSGKYFINLSNLLVNRDNFRQAVADLFALTAAIPGIDVNGGGPDLDGDNIFFVGHSLGALVGTTFLALEPNVKDAVLAFGGTSIAKLLDGSAAFSPSIVEGLYTESGGTIDKGATLDSEEGILARAAYESFFAVTQTAVDTADPVNFSTAAVANRGLLFFEIVGDGVTPGTSDLVVPNTVPDLYAIYTNPLDTVPAPLAGTEPQLSLMGLQQVDNSQSSDTDLKLSVKFIYGDHGSILDPTASEGVTTELQLEMASFLVSEGKALTVTDASVIQQLAP